MEVEAYIIVWNEIDTIQFTIDHYKKICDRITFFDNHSNDGTAEKIIENGCILQSFGSHGKLEDKEYLRIKNNCWKQSTADWVIVVDCDEIIWHPDLERVFNSKGTVFKTIGWDVHSKYMPEKDFLEIKTGVYSKNYSKLAVFSPNISSINYVYGCHVADPVGNVEYCEEKLVLFHYRNIGGADRLVERHKLYRNRLSEFNKKWELGVHYTHQDDQRIKDWNERYNNSTEFDFERALLLGN